MKKKGVNVLQMLLLLAVGVVCGLFLGGFMARYIDPEKPFWIQGVVLLAVLYVSFFLTIPIHEAGHLVFGLLTGYRFSSYRIGSLMWVSDGENIRFRRFTLSGTGGQCLMCPPELVDGKIPYVLYNLGGVVFNLLAALVGGGLWLLMPDKGLLSASFAIWSLLHVLTALTNGIPMRTATVDNDGRNAIQLGEHPAALRAFWLQMKVNERISRGERLRQMPEEWFRMPSDEELQNSMCAAIGVFRENWLLDQGKLEEALAASERLLRDDTAVVAIHRSLLVCDQISCRLLLGQGKEAVAGLRTKEQLRFMKQMKTFPSVLRTEYLLARLADEDREKAGEILEKFDKVAKKYPYPSDIEGEREIMALAAQATCQ